MDILEAASFYVILFDIFFYNQVFTYIYVYLNRISLGSLMLLETIVILIDEKIGHPFVVTFIVVSKTSLPNLSISFSFYKYMILTLCTV